VNDFQDVTAVISFVRALVSGRFVLFFELKLSFASVVTVACLPADHEVTGSNPLLCFSRKSLRCASLHTTCTFIARARVDSAFQPSVGQ